MWRISGAADDAPLSVWYYPEWNSRVADEAAVMQNDQRWYADLRGDYVDVIWRLGLKETFAKPAGKRELRVGFSF